MALAIAPIGFDLSESSDIDPPVFPGGISGIVATNPNSGGDILLTWNVATDADSGLKQYNVYYSTVSGNVFSDGIKLSIPTGTVTATVGGLSNGTQYFFGVRAEDEDHNETNNNDTDDSTPSDGNGESVILVDAGGIGIMLENT